MEKKNTEPKENPDLLTQNYKDMDETGREKLKEVSDQFLKVHNIVIGENGKNNDKKKGKP